MASPESSVTAGRGNRECLEAAGGWPAAKYLVCGTKDPQKGQEETWQRCDLGTVTGFLRSSSLKPGCRAASAARQPASAGTKKQLSLVQREE